MQSFWFLSSQYFWNGSPSKLSWLGDGYHKKIFFCLSVALCLIISFLPIYSYYILKYNMKNKKENKKENAIIVKDLSLNTLLTSHLSEFQKDLNPSLVIYNGAKKSPRWAGSFSKNKIFTLSHYSTPILKVNIVKSSAELVALPDNKPNSNGDLRGMNTVLKVFGLTLQAIKRQGITRLLHYSTN